MKSREKYFFYCILGVTSVISVAVFWPFITVIVVGAAFATVLHPIFLRLDKHFRIPWLAALATVLLFIAVLCIPLFILGIQIFDDSQALFKSISDGSFVSNSFSRLSEVAGLNITSYITDIASFFAGKIGTVLTSTLQAAASF